MATKKKKTKSKKIRVLALQTGYAETASISVLLLKHETGFKTMKDALSSLRAAVVEALHDEVYGDYPVDDSDDAVHKYVYGLIHGDYQSHGEFWEAAHKHGWLMNDCWIGRNLKDIHHVECAEELIAEPEEFAHRF